MNGLNNNSALQFPQRAFIIGHQQQMKLPAPTHAGNPRSGSPLSRFNEEFLRGRKRNLPPLAILCILSDRSERMPPEGNRQSERRRWFSFAAVPRSFDSALRAPLRMTGVRERGERIATPVCALVRNDRIGVRREFAGDRSAFWPMLRGAMWAV